jgi:hypothetical protein
MRAIVLLVTVRPIRQGGKRCGSSRVIIEQAKGKLAERLGIDTTEAFSILRSYAPNRNLRLADLAQAFTDGTEPLIGQTPARSPGDR